MRYVYSPPVGTGTDNYALTVGYRTTAKKVAASEVELAGERLAAFLNSELR